MLVAAPPDGAPCHSRKAPEENDDVRPMLMRAGYFLAVLASLVVAWLSISGHVLEIMRFPTAGPAFFMLVIRAAALGGGLFGLGFAGLLGYLAFRPKWWGKLVCAFAGVSWTLFSVSATLMHRGSPSPFSLWPGAAGAVLLTCAILHHLADPTFGPPPPAKADSPPPRPPAQPRPFG